MRSYLQIQSKEVSGNKGPAKGACWRADLLEVGEMEVDQPTVGVLSPQIEISWPTAMALPHGCCIVEMG